MKPILRKPDYSYFPSPGQEPDPTPTPRVWTEQATESPREQLKRRESTL